MTLKKVISGGQTGIDQMALAVAKAAGLATGGQMPKGFSVEGGSDPSVAKEFCLTESPHYNYQPRTLNNVQESDATVWFGDPTSPGGVLTLKYAVKEGKPYFINPTASALAQWVEELKIEVLNVAGNRRTPHNGEMIDKARETFEDALTLLTLRVTTTADAVTETLVTTTDKAVTDGSQD
jgi:hypothetical protein